MRSARLIVRAAVPIPGSTNDDRSLPSDGLFAQPQEPALDFLTKKNQNVTTFSFLWETMEYGQTRFHIHVRFFFRPTLSFTDSFFSS